ncbi:hypothetical protein N656DRAFT_781364 [Canariomyces notabilis]|uniref:Uncharacterized protein n=1 Tax=Canariomyces notabilis TaxID=2074819 RepID=A0AAN6QI33_9PEZI|nr:hypothetical protein N656DRAFT_781364 [Canariomyces arenarius]
MAWNRVERAGTDMGLSTLWDIRWFSYSPAQVRGLAFVIHGAQTAGLVGAFGMAVHMRTWKLFARYTHRVTEGNSFNPDRVLLTSASVGL